MFSSRDQPQDRGARSSQPRMAQQSLEDQSHNDAKVLEETKAHEAADKESTGNIDLLKVIKSDFSTHLAKTHRDRGECCGDS